MSYDGKFHLFMFMLVFDQFCISYVFLNSEFALSLLGPLEPLEILDEHVLLAGYCRSMMGELTSTDPVQVYTGLLPDRDGKIDTHCPCSGIYIYGGYCRAMMGKLTSTDPVQVYMGLLPDRDGKIDID